MKKYIMKLAVTGLFVTMFAVPCFASTYHIYSQEEVVIASENYGAGYEEPELRSIARPTKVWNIENDGAYNFAGSAEGSTLYTNYKFKGKTSYTITVNNNHEKT